MSSSNSKRRTLRSDEVASKLPTSSASGSSLSPSSLLLSPSQQSIQTPKKVPSARKPKTVVPEIDLATQWRDVQTCEQAVVEGVNRILDRVGNYIVAKHIQRVSEETTAIHCIEYALDAVEFHAKQHDPGERTFLEHLHLGANKSSSSSSSSSSYSSDQLWTAEDEPKPCQIDSWARGVIPLKKRFSPPPSSLSSPSSSSSSSFSSASSFLSSPHVSCSSSSSSLSSSSSPSSSCHSVDTPLSEIHAIKELGASAAGSVTSRNAASRSFISSSSFSSFSSSSSSSSFSFSSSSRIRSSRPSGSVRLSTVKKLPTVSSSSSSSSSSSLWTAAATTTGTTVQSLAETKTIIIPLEPVVTVDHQKRERLRQTELRRIDNQKKEQERTLRVKQQMEEESKKLQRLQEELKGKQYTYDSNGQILIVNQVKVEQLPNLRICPDIQVDDIVSNREEKKPRRKKWTATSSTAAIKPVRRSRN
eukprot:TRINITY_DN705_c0_g2_i2.p1 TRINITY_DN705_c0_g2~~TRINITY_DN705_c0_g2_i2.p1  ORF type:complete len:474 (+),score=174.59 TRINITY_DN705_c0_g2_i2:71-1492(+)